jgi:hypothetical protein
MNPNIYHNTTRLTDTLLCEAIKKAAKQDRRIMNFFVENQGKEFTPCQVHKELFDDTVPLTSVRRSITNLTDEGKLTMTKTKREGLFGRPTHCWTLKSNTNELDIFKI